MKIPQWLKKPLRLVAMGAEPKDSAPLQLSQEVQRVLSIPCGIDRQTLIPMKGNIAGATEVLPICTTGLNQESDCINSYTQHILTKTYDLVEICCFGGAGYVTYGCGVEDKVAIPDSGGISVDASGVAYLYSIFRIHGKIDRFTPGDIASNSDLWGYFVATEFAHGKEG